MFLDDHPPIAGGRELWGFPKKLAKPTLHDEIDTLVGTLDYGPVRIATGAISTRPPIVMRSWRRCWRRIFCSRSCRMWTGRHAFASWSNTN
jgi:hypothetical protein